MSVSPWEPQAIYRIMLDDELALSHVTGAIDLARAQGFDTIRISPIIPHAAAGTDTAGTGAAQSPTSPAASTRALHPSRIDRITDDPLNTRDRRAEFPEFARLVHEQGLRLMVDWEPFDADHQLAPLEPIEQWAAAGLVDGLCVRHVDSLPNPQTYLDALSQFVPFVLTERRLTLFPSSPRETLPAEWNASASGGYPLIAAVDGALTHLDGFYKFEALRQLLAAGMDPSESQPSIPELATHLRRNPTSVTGLLTQLETAAKREVAAEDLRSNMQRLAGLAQSAWDELSPELRETIGSDPTAAVSTEQLTELFAALAAALPVARVEIPQDDHAYRSFLATFTGEVTGDFVAIGSTGEVPSMGSGALYIGRALSRVRSTAQARVASNELLAYLGILLTTPGDPVAELFAQTTSLILRKGVTGRAHYRYCALAALCEVGGSPARPRGLSGLATELKVEAQERSRAHTSTVFLESPITKYPAHVRGRAVALAEAPAEFIEFLTVAMRVAPLADAVNENTRVISGSAVDSGHALEVEARTAEPADQSFESLLWQSLAANWVPDLDREILMFKAVRAARRASRFTTHRNPSAAYENSVRAALDACFTNPELNAAMNKLNEVIAAAGYSNYQVARAFQLMSPGIPEFAFSGQEIAGARGEFAGPGTEGAVGAHTSSAGAGEPADAVQTSISREPATQGFTDAVQEAVPQILALRAKHADNFTTAPHLVTASGSGTDLICGFAYADLAVVGVRLPITLQRRGGFGDTTFTIPQVTAGSEPPSHTSPLSIVTTAAQPADQPAARWRDVLSKRIFDGSQLSAAEVFASQPVVILERVKD